MMFPKGHKKRNKYGAKKVFADGVSYDSKLEYNRHNYLKLLEIEGEISDLQAHPAQIHICCGVNYRPDFIYIENGVQIVEDTKAGGITDGGRFPTIKKLWPFFMDSNLRVVIKQGNSYKIKNEIKPLTKEAQLLYFKELIDT